MGENPEFDVRPDRGELQPATKRLLDKIIRRYQRWSENLMGGKGNCMVAAPRSNCVLYAHLPNGPEGMVGFPTPVEALDNRSVDLGLFHTIGLVFGLDPIRERVLSRLLKVVRSYRDFVAHDKTEGEPYADSYPVMLVWRTLPCYDWKDDFETCERKFKVSARLLIAHKPSWLLDKTIEEVLR